MKNKKEKLVETAKKEKITDANIQDTRNKCGFLIIGISLLFLICIGIYWAFQNPNYESLENKDGAKFKEEYEALNCKEDDEDCKNLTLDIEKDNPIVYSSYEEIFKLLEDGTGVIYFGFPGCPWCRNLVPVMIDAAEEVGITEIYYLNNREDRNTIELDSKGKPKTTKEGTDNYFKLLEEIGTFASNYTVYDKNDKEVELEEKRLYFPTILVVKDGQVVAFHEATVKSQENPYVALTEDQVKELKDTLVDKMTKTIICDGAC